MQPSVVVVDYGLGNLMSVRRGLESCGAAVEITSDPDRIRAANKVVLPGVGSFRDGMTSLERLGLADVLTEVAAAGTPLLGICLGMQMLMEHSVEFGSTEGLGLLKGSVVALPRNPAANAREKVPSIGWSALVLPDSGHDWQDSILRPVSPGEEVYFLHSYMAVPNDPGERLADYLWNGQRVTAAVRKGPIVGCQFHPEKSGGTGLRVLNEFLNGD